MSTTTPTTTGSAGAPGTGDFRRLWAGQSLSLLGDQFMVLALPLLAVTVLGASASKAALLPFAFYLPFLVLGLPAGALADRFSRRATMLACDAVQGAIFLVIAVLAALRALPFPLLLGLVGVSGVANVFFQVAYTSYLPTLFGDARDLHRGNARLFFSESVSRTLGPMIAGPLIGAIGVVGAVAANVMSFVASVVAVASIRTREPAAPARLPLRGGILRDVWEGLRFVFRHPELEPVISCGVVYVLFLSMVEASLVLYAREILGLGTAGIGLVIGAAAAGFPVGNALSGKLGEACGVPRTLVAGALLSVCGLVLVPVAGSAGSVAGVVVASMVHGVGEGAFGPCALTHRQTTAPAALLARVNSVQRFFIWGANPMGSLLASAAIATAGLGAAVWIGCLGTALCLPLLIRRGIRVALLAGSTPLLPEPATRD